MYHRIPVLFGGRVSYNKSIDQTISIHTVEYNLEKKKRN